MRRLVLSISLAARSSLDCFAANVLASSAQFTGQASGTPASALKYPFTKQFSAVDKVVDSWWNGSGGLACTANPDFALRFPCPYKVVGETKYFRKGGIDAARTELVRSVYQCFYYRGLPIVQKPKSVRLGTTSMLASWPMTPPGMVRSREHGSQLVRK
jgi:hypothetical protein